MKRCPTGHATHPQWRMAAALVLAQLRAQMALPGYAHAPTLGLLYITDHYASEAQALLDFLSAELPEVTDWSGTVGIGVCASNAQYFDEPALAVMLLDIPCDQYRVFSGVAPLPRVGEGRFVAHTALVHADGNTPDVTGLVAEMAERTTSGYVFGGLAASRGASVQFAVGGSGNLAGHGAAGGVFLGGLSGVAWGPGVHWLSRITQGCQPVGPVQRITAAQDNVVLALDGEPALDVLLRTLDVSLEGDPQIAVERVRATLAGLMDAGEEPGTCARTGHFGPDTRVRHILGLDGARHGVALAESIEPGMWLAFCQCRAAAAHADLTRICAEVREELSPDVLEPFLLGSTAPEQALAVPPQRHITGAIYVSCSTR
ncbi:MAG: FIST N-terminal domain-containing protein, partial [Simplicispira sp.]|uniref:FIST signal transduction protein n=1 Tax=Simplicispira sp. TaxID=2015802 RepID=UPI00258C115A